MNALIIEDEKMARTALAHMVEANFPDIAIIGMTGSVRESVEWLRTNTQKLDLIFMDVELSDGDCFEIFRQVEICAKVVMTTAYDSYAIKAFEAGSIDYLLKPIDQAALRRALSRCHAPGPEIDVNALLKAIQPQQKDWKERIVVHFNDRIVPVRTDEIAYIYSGDKCNTLVTFSGARYVVDSNLDELSGGLNPELFFKISRSCIVAMKAIKSITRQVGGRLRISAEPQPDFEMTVSRSRSDEFLTWIEK